MKRCFFILMLLFAIVINVSSSFVHDDKKNRQEKLSMTLRSALSGDAQAQYTLGKSYVNGEFTDRDGKMGIYWLELAAAQKHVEAIRKLASIYTYRNGGRNKSDKAIKLYRLLADSINDTDAMIRVGEIYCNGWGTDINKDSALYWYNRALELGSEKAQSYIESLKKGQISFSDEILNSTTRIRSIPQPLFPIAFILGNSDYTSSYLPNPVNDAKALRKKFKDLGIISKLNMNLGREEMYDSIDAFAEESAMYDVAIFYYAGHAVQDHGVNYLIPIDFVKKDDYTETLAGCVNVDDIFECFKNHGVKSCIVILDACRDNRALFGRSRGAGQKGLSPSSLKPLGSFVAYATQSGEIADDGEEGGNSPFMKAFLSVLDQPNKQIYDVFEQVKAIVSKESKGRQIPVYVNNLRKNFIFNNPELYEQ
ncbi:MAG: caspase family protein [Prevotella sp.]|nr:caspase family protein [Prevotella sp.]